MQNKYNVGDLFEVLISDVNLNTKLFMIMSETKTKNHTGHDFSVYVVEFIKTGKLRAVHESDLQRWIRDKRVKLAETGTNS